MTQQSVVDWYFDFISPFAYLQFKRLQQIEREQTAFQLRYHPVLFAGLLQHNQQKGPAEIPAKRELTYRHCHWLAEQHGFPYQTPASHPFNPLPFLRAAIAKNCDPEIIAALFHHIWVASANTPDFAQIDAITTLPGLENIAAEISDASVKDRLRLNTESAIANGVFGVPTLQIDSTLFWGFDMTDMALDFLRNPGLLESAEYQRINNLPIGQARR